jgi:hypothetical protein
MCFCQIVAVLGMFYLGLVQITAVYAGFHPEDSTILRSSVRRSHITVYTANAVTTRGFLHPLRY